MDNKIQKLWDDLAEWSNNTFGPVDKRGPLSPLNKLKEEIEELIKEPYDKLEYADALHLIFDAARRAGISLELLIKSADDKLQINKLRSWGEPNENGVFQHLKCEFCGVSVRADEVCNEILVCMACNK